MSIVLLVYLASIVGSLKVVLTLLIIAGILFYGMVGGCMVAIDGKSFSDMHLKRFIIGFLFAILAAVAIPNERTIYIMAGASIAQDIANSPKTAATLDKVYKIIDKKLEEQLPEGIDKVTKKIENKVEETVK